MFDPSFTAQLSALGATWLPVLVDAAVKGTAVLVVACIAGLFARRASAATRHLIWFLAMVSLLAMPVLSMVLPGWQVLPEWFDLSGAAALGTDEPALRPPFVEPLVPPATDGSASPAGVGPHIPGDTAGGSLEVGDSEARTATASRAAPPATVVEERRPWSAASLRVWILPVWAAGAAAALAPMLIAMLSLWRLRRASRRVTNGPCAALVERLSAELGLKRRVALLQSGRRSMPMAWGLVRPKLLIPDEAEGWSPECLRAVLLHEIAHIKRWDCLTQLVARVACGLYWFNPLAWLALHRMVAEHERACDDVVLAAGGKAPEYAEHLLKVASHLPAVRFSLGVGIALARPSKLEGRLLAILDGGRSRRAVSRAALLAAVVALVCLVAPLAVMRPMAQAMPDAEAPVVPAAASGDGAVRMSAAGAEDTAGEITIHPDGRMELRSGKGTEVSEGPGSAAATEAQVFELRYAQAGAVADALRRACPEDTTRIVSDPRANRIVAIAPPGRLAQIAELVRQLDQAAGDGASNQKSPGSLPEDRKETSEAEPQKTPPIAGDARARTGQRIFPLKYQEADASEAVVSGNTFQRSLPGKPAEVKAVPAGLSGEAVYFSLTVGPRKVLALLEVASPPRLFVDVAGTGDLSAVQPLTARPWGPVQQFGPVDIPASGKARPAVRVRFLCAADKYLAASKDLAVAPAGYMAGEVNLDGQPYRVALVDHSLSGRAGGYHKCR